MNTLLESLSSGLSPYDSETVKSVEELANTRTDNLIERIRGKKAAEVLQVYRNKRLEILKERHLLSMPINFSFLSIEELKVWRKLETAFPTGNIPKLLMLSSQGTVVINGRDTHLLAGAVVKLTPQATFDLIEQGNAIIYDDIGEL